MAEKWTERDIPDQKRRVAVVTGANSGLGFETARALAQRGASVVLAVRNVKKGQQAARRMTGEISVQELDLTSLESVRAAAANLCERYPRIDLLINNAGVMYPPKETTQDGFELQFATNHLGHFALVNRLRPAFAADVRVVSVSSAGHHLSDIRWDDLHFTRGDYDPRTAYGQSKTANALFAVHLNTLGVQAFSVHPGNILTPLQRHMDPAELVANGWVDEDGNVIDSSFKSPEQGAATQVWAATAPQLSTMGGLYCADCDVAELTEPNPNLSGVRDYAVDPAAAARLWTLSEELTSVAS